jgi:hypothetical protein
VPRLAGDAATRADTALERRGRGDKDDVAALRAEWAMLMHISNAALRTTS